MKLNLPDVLIQSSPFQFDDSSWLQGIEQEAVIVDSWQAEAEKLTRIAIEAFKRLKENTTNVKDETKLNTFQHYFIIILTIPNKIRYFYFRRDYVNEIMS